MVFDPLVHSFFHQLVGVVGKIACGSDHDFLFVQEQLHHIAGLIRNEFTVIRADQFLHIVADEVD